MIEHIHPDGGGGTGDRGDSVQRKIAEAPDSPGVYIFKGSGGEVLYVGKARSLRARLRSYLASDLPPKTHALMERARDLELLTTESEAEALILESNLIKKHRPRYNIRLKDDKNYPYIRIGLSEEWPAVTVVRKMKKDGARYFGPYTRSGAVRETLKLLKELFPHRTCNDAILKTQRRPCLQYDLGRCPAPCAGLCSRESYMQTVGEMIRFLEGKHREVRDDLERQMREKAESLDFETAAKIRDRIRALDEMASRQKAVTPDMEDRDVLGFYPHDDDGYAAVLLIREGKLLGREGFRLTGVRDEPLAEVLSAFISQYYATRATEIPREILIPDAGADEATLSQLLSTISGKRVTVLAPRRGFKRELVRMAQENARVLVAQLIPLDERRKAEDERALCDLAALLGLASPPRRIEGYDVSNIGGKQATASMVVLQDGRPDKSSYRRFKLTKAQPDDYAMMEEVLRRRFSRALEEIRSGSPGKFSVLPDLVLVDGGAGQVAVACRVLRELGLELPVAGLAKKNEEVYLPGRTDPLVLPRNSGALYLIMRVRNEAHRFALSYHRKVRNREAVSSVLDGIRGLGERKKRELLASFGSVDNLARAPVEEIQKVRGIGPVLASRIAEALVSAQRERRGGEEEAQVQ